MWIIVYYSHSYNSSIHILLTDKVIRNAKTKTSKYNLKDTSGLFVRVNPQGSKIFFFRYKWLEKDTLLNIGEYGKWSLTKAREKRDQLIDDLAVGINPKEESTKGATFTIMAHEWLEAKQYNWSDKTKQTNKKRLSYAIDDLGLKQIESITPKDVLNVCRKIERRGSINAAKRTRAIIGSVFKYHMLYDVSERVKDSLLHSKPKNHPHFTEKKDIKKLLNDIDNYRGSYEARMALKFVAYTFVRSRPLREAEWTEIDGDMWRVPAHKEKTNRPLLVPLSTQAQELLKEIKQINGDKKYIFNSNYRDGFLGESTLGRILTRMGYGGKHSVHGYRHMASTCLNELEYDGDAIELQLSHAPVGVRGVYNKAKKLNYRTKMMQDWADWLDGL
jgi:integrase